MADEGQSRVFAWTSTDQATHHSEDETMSRGVQEAATFPKPIAINPNQNKRLFLLKRPELPPSHRKLSSEVLSTPSARRKFKKCGFEACVSDARC